jgi:hypothetical protein
LTAIGAKRHCPIIMPYHTAALRSLVGTNLIATVPRSIANLEASNPGLRIIKAPRLLGTFKYLMAWHPRLTTDSAHIWLRSIIRVSGKAIFAK